MTNPNPVDPSRRLAVTTALNDSQTSGRLYDALLNTHYNQASQQLFQSELRSYRGPNAPTYRQLS